MLALWASPPQCRRAEPAQPPAQRDELIVCHFFISRDIEIVVGRKSRERMARKGTQAHISALGLKMRLSVLCCAGLFR